MEENKELATTIEETIEEPKQEEVQEEVKEETQEVGTPNKVYEELRKTTNSFNALKEENDALKKRVAELESEVETLRSSNGTMESQIKASHNAQLVDELGIDTKYTEDIIALIVGKGEEVNDENITKIANEHKEWKRTIVETEGVKELGVTKQNTEISDKEKFHNWWNA